MWSPQDSHFIIIVTFNLEYIPESEIKHISGKSAVANTVYIFCNINVWLEPAAVWRAGPVNSLVSQFKNWKKGPFYGGLFCAESSY